MTGIPEKAWRGAAVLALAFSTAFWSCQTHNSLTRKRAKNVEKGLLRTVYLQGLQPQKLSLAERMAFYKVPGVSIAAVDRGTLEWARVYGERDIQTHDPVAADTLFQAGALSQMVTAALALRLADEGLYGLDEEPGSILKTWKIPPEAGLPAGRITPRNLLLQTAGFSDQVFQGYAAGEPLPSLTQILSGIPPARNGPVWIPPRRSASLRAWPSEGGFLLIQQMLQDASGRSFDRLAEDIVFGPLGLKRSTFAVEPPEGLTAAAGHQRDGRILPGLRARYPESAAKGLWTSPSDFAAFILRLLRDAEGKGTGILRPATARLMLSPQVENYAFGFFADGQGDDIQFHLNGKTRGFACVLVVYPAKGQGTVIMTNSDNGDLLIGEILCAFSAAYGWPHYRPEAKPVLRLASETYDEFLGRYEVNERYALEVRREDYYLVITPTGQAPTKFYAEGQTLFYSVDPYVRIQFFRDSGGRIDGLVLWQKDFRLDARKVR